MIANDKDVLDQAKQDALQDFGAEFVRRVRSLYGS